MTLTVSYPFNEWTDSPELRVVALGPGRVEWQGRALTSRDFRYSKAREMLFYLIGHPARTKEQIGLALWPDVTTTQLNDSFRISLHHLRKALRTPDWILYEGGLYSFNRAFPVWYDVEAFEFSCSAAQLALEGGNTSMSVAANHLERASSLYRGDFLEGYEGEWCILVREDLQRKYLQVLVAWGQLLLDAGDYLQSCEILRRAIAKDSYFESAHRGLLRCLARQGEHGQALRHYQDLSTLLDKELSAPPAPETVALNERLRRGEPL
jgi:DNA-binding SARP family transcriptional activator